MANIIEQANAAYEARDQAQALGALRLHGLAPSLRLRARCTTLRHDMRRSTIRHDV